MKRHFSQRSTSKKNAAFWAGALILALGFIFMLAVQPAQADVPAQDGYPVVTSTPTLSGGATAAVTPTLQRTATATRTGTVAAPGVTGTPTQLVPVTGADLSEPGGSGPGAIALRVILGLLGLLLIGFGLKARPAKR